MEIDLIFIKEFIIKILLFYISIFWFISQIIIQSTIWWLYDFCDFL